MSQEPQGREPSRHAGEQSIVAMTVPIASLVVVRVGLAIWTVGLIVVWTVPSLTTHDQWWWRWVPVAALVVGLLGHAYVVRGRGNAKQA